MGNWTDIKFGSIYHALKKLVDRGSVAVVGAERHTGRPDRTIYRITKQGEAEFARLLSDLLERFQRIYFDLDIGLFFAAQLPNEKLSAVIEKRQDEVDFWIKRLADVKKLPVHRKLPRISEVIVDHTIYHLNAERDWTKMCARRLRDENLYVPPPAAKARRPRPS